MLIRTSILSDYFEEALSDLRCHRDTKSYLVGVYSKYLLATEDLSKDSITLLYAKAKTNQDFITFQQISEWLLMCSTLYPQHLKNASFDYYATIARNSYYSCYRLVNKSWQVYENLADDFIPITSKIKSVLIEK